MGSCFTIEELKEHYGTEAVCRIVVCGESSYILTEITAQGMKALLFMGEGEKDSPVELPDTVEVYVVDAVSRVSQNPDRWQHAQLLFPSIAPRVESLRRQFKAMAPGRRKAA